MHVCMCMNVLNGMYVYAACVDVIFHCTMARVTGCKACCECTIVIIITYLRTGGVDAYRGIKVLLGGPFAHGHRVALRHLPCIGPHHVEPNHPLLQRKNTANQSTQSWCLNFYIPVNRIGLLTSGQVASSQLLHSTRLKY